MDIDLAIHFSNTVSDFTKPQERVDRLLTALPLCARKARARTREEIEKRYYHGWIQLQSLLVVGVLWWWVHVARGWPPLFLYPLGAHFIAS